MVEFARVVVLLLGGFALGLTVAVLVLYLRLWRSPYASHVPPYHVPMVAIAHGLLIVSGEAAIIQHVYRKHAFEWWVSPVLVIAYALTTAALVGLLRSHKLRKLSADVQAHRL